MCIMGIFDNNTVGRTVMSLAFIQVPLVYTIDTAVNHYMNIAHTEKKCKLKH